MKSTPLYSLGDILTLERRPVRVVLDAEYAEIGIYSFGRGIFHKPARTGFEVGNKKLFLVKEGDFIPHITFAWEGAIGLASKAEDGMYGSVRFPTFRVDESLCYPPYLLNYFRTETGREQLAGISPGSAGRNRVLSLRRIPEIMVPLPPLDEQLRIVARIEELAALIEKARDLRVQARDEASNLLGATSSQLFSTTAKVNKSCPIGDIISFRNDLIRPSDGESGSARFVGLQHIESHTGKKLGEDRVLVEELGGRKFRFSPGEIVYGYLRPYLNKVWIADCEGICSVDQYVIRPDQRIVNIRYLAHFMRSPIFLGQAIELTHNLLLPRLRKALLKGVAIPLPSLPEQCYMATYLDDLQTQIDELTTLQNATQVELGALLPSVLDRAFRGEL
jgi:type I restriction enzyme S subunit